MMDPYLGTSAVLTMASGRSQSLISLFSLRSLSESPDSTERGITSWKFIGKSSSVMLRLSTIVRFVYSAYVYPLGLMFGSGQTLAFSSVYS